MYQLTPNPTEAELLRLITDQVEESQVIDYKLTAYDRNDEGTREMLRDITSFANAAGGHIVIGMQEDGASLPVSVTGIEKSEEEVTRILAQCRSCIDERVSGLDVSPVRLSNGRIAPVIYVPRSLRAPHMVTFKGLNQFWKRYDKHKDRMTVEEIRAVCARTEGLRVALTEFLDVRWREMMSEQAEFGLYIAFAPLILDESAIDVFDPWLEKTMAHPPYNRTNGWTCDAYSGVEPSLCGMLGQGKGQLEVHRNGYCDFLVSGDSSFRVRTLTFEDGDIQVIHPWTIAEYVVSVAHFVRSVGDKYALTLPFVVRCGLLRGRTMSLPTIRNTDEWDGTNTRPIGDKQVRLDLQVPSNFAPMKVAQDTCDRLWNAVGARRCFLFDDRGIFTP
jgi:hypothetical protein